MNIKSQTKLFCVESGYSLTYDAENRLIGVSGAATATFVYDGDGKRVRGSVGGTTTTYISNYLEWTGSTSTMKRYYYAGGTRVAMRTGSSTLNYLLGDHSLVPRDRLGSQSITTNSSGEPPSSSGAGLAQPPPNTNQFGGGVDRYMPWGEK